MNNLLASMLKKLSKITLIKWFWFGQQMTRLGKNKRAEGTWVCFSMCELVWVCMCVCACGWVCVGGCVWLWVFVCGRNQIRAISKAACVVKNVKLNISIRILLESLQQGGSNAEVFWVVLSSLKLYYALKLDLQKVSKLVKKCQSLIIVCDNCWG